MNGCQYPNSLMNLYTRRRCGTERMIFALQFEWYSVDFIEMCSHCLLNKRGLFTCYATLLCFGHAFGYAFPYISEHNFQCQMSIDFQLIEYYNKYRYILCAIQLNTSLIYPTVKLSTMSTSTILPQSNLCLGCCQHIFPTLNMK